LNPLINLLGAMTTLTMGSAAPAPAPIEAERAELIEPGSAGGFERLDAATVRFNLENASARAVSLIGDWNNWTPVPLHADPRGIWRLNTAIPPGRHLYRFIVDGLPAIDPANGAIDLAPDGGLASVVDSGSTTPQQSTIKTEEPIPTRDSTPTLGPLKLGIRYRGRLTQDLREGDLQAAEGEHLLDLPVAAHLPGKGWIDLLFGAHSQADTDHANLELLRLRAEMRSGRARVRLFRNHPALPGGAAPINLITSRGRFAYPLGLQARGASARLRLGDFRATITQMDEQDGLFGPSARLGAAAISTPLGAGHIFWSGARETDRAVRYVQGDQAWAAFPADVDSLREDESRSLGWQLAAQWDPPHSQEAGLFLHAAWTEGRNDWIPNSEWIGGVERTVASNAPIRATKTRGFSASCGWMNALTQRPAVSTASLSSWRLSWIQERIAPTATDISAGPRQPTVTTNRFEGLLHLDLLRWQMLMHAAFRHSSGTVRDTDPLLTDWIWRGLVPGAGRAEWWELPLLGRPNLAEIGLVCSYPYTPTFARPAIAPLAMSPRPLPQQRAQEKRWAMRALARAYWDDAAAPALMLLQASAERSLGSRTYLTGDLLLLNHQQPRLGLDQWLVSPFVAAGQRLDPNLSIQIGLGVNPYRDDPVSREQTERGREEFILEGDFSYASLAAQEDRDFARDFKRREQRLNDRIRLELKVIYQFGEPRSTILKGHRE
jgi:hypothetical protein